MPYEKKVELSGGGRDQLFGRVWLRRKYIVVPLAIAPRGLREGAVPRDEAPQEEHEPVPTSATAKRKPRQPKEPKQPKESKRNSKVITVDVGHTEYFDDLKNTNSTIGGST